MQPDVVICDEGHELKNRKIQLYKHLERMKTKKRIMLTGTPIQNNIMEFYNIVNFAKPWILDSESNFRLRFARPIKRGTFKDSSNEDVQVMKERLSVLTNHLKKFMNRKDVTTLEPYLKPKFEYVLSILMSDHQKDVYDHQMQTINSSKGSRNVMNDHKKLQKICNHPDQGSKMAVFLAIVEKCREINEKILAFTESLESLDTIEELLKTRGWQENTDYMRMDGTRMPKMAGRKAAVDSFNSPMSPCKLFLISPRTGGQGLNLIGASRVVVFDISWNPTRDIQAISRAYRLGQQKPVHIYRLVAKGEQ